LTENKLRSLQWKQHSLFWEWIWLSFFWM